ncbi:hypothetical protein HQN86_00510 [Pedobacter panaciterrae]|uniref:hypothetical protein n=1 Tax=Pedobacter panaciterrae TaxID=363849 RepID=UPI00155DA2CD|nr:hypothetical protein [Pedobacter panaciterrae]NQX52084.1 hypothetical protein [Pedobacter panaciterrae]
MGLTKGHIIWESVTVLLKERIFLFCFGEKCMSGKISNIVKLDSLNEFEIEVEFIEPDYFADELTPGNSFTIREASKVLGVGKIK